MTTETLMVLTASHLAAELVSRGIRKDDRSTFHYGTENPPFWSSRRNVMADPPTSVINVVRSEGLMNWIVRYEEATGEIYHVSINDGGGHALIYLGYWPGFEWMEKLSDVLERTWVPHCQAQGDWKDAQEAGE